MANFLLGEFAPRTKQVVGGKSPNIFFWGGKWTKILKVLFRGVDEGADDEATESGVGIGVSVGIAVGFLAVGSVFLLPLGTEFGGVQDDRGLVDRVLESRDSALAFGRNWTFIRMFNRISMRATIASAHNNLFFRSEFARHGVERMRESGACHRVRQSHALTNDVVVVRALDASTLSSSSRNSRMFSEGDSSLPSEGIRISNYGCKGTENLRDMQVFV